MQANALSPSSQEEGLNCSLELLTARAASFCPNLSVPILIGSDPKARKAVFARPGCGLWSCPVCGPKNGMRWVKRTMHAYHAIGGQWTFVTITASGKWRGKRSLVNIRKNWPKLRKRAARKVEGEFYYLWVYERHKDKSWHVHMLTNATFKSKWWKDNSAECGMGHQCKSIKLENVGQAIGYIAKYLMKQMVLIPPYPKDMRRITTSQNFPKLPGGDYKEQELHWMPTRDRDHAQHLGEFYKAMHWEVVNMRTTIRQVDKLTS